MTDRANDSPAASSARIAAMTLLLISGAMLAGASIATERSWGDVQALAVPRVPFAIAANVIFAAAGWRLRAVTVGGALAGAAIGVCVAVGAGAAAWWFLLVSFAVAVSATRAGGRRKHDLRIAETRGGRRGAGNAIGNTGVAAAAAAVILGTGSPMALVMLVASIVTSVSDTVASEIGKAWGRTAWLVTTFRRAQPGTTGAISIEGTLACAGAAVLLSSLAVAFGLIPIPVAARVAVAATIASILEGAAGATLERSGVLDNDGTNLLNSLAGGVLAVAFSLML